MTNGIKKMTASILCQHSVNVLKYSAKVEIIYDNYVVTLFNWHRPKEVMLNIQFAHEEEQPELYENPDCFIEITTRSGNYVFRYPHDKRHIMFEDYERIRQALQPFMEDKVNRISQ
jgi:hypothetical protein